MRTSHVIGALMLATVLGTALTAAEEGAVKWTSDFEAAKKTAAEQNKKLFIEFTAEW
ncbi:MAG: hypothetical protein KDB32_03775 [Planctomycetes bacterium]|nr:hypothetical protein [Planctomycetota bacterium]